MSTATTGLTAAARSSPNILAAVSYAGSHCSLLRSEREPAFSVIVGAMSEHKKAIIIGGHGHVALFLAPLLVNHGFDVTSVVRNPDHVAEVEQTGATAKVADIAVLDAVAWDELLADTDVVVWSAGAGGKGGPDATYAIDRDAAIASINAATRASTPPRYIMVSFVGSLTDFFEQKHPLYHYALAKRVADEALLDSPLESIILGPTTLNHNAAGGVKVFDSTKSSGGTTSRELVAQVAAAAATAKHVPQGDARVLEFFDGDTPVADLFS